MIWAEFVVYNDKLCTNIITVIIMYCYSVPALFAGMSVQNAKFFCFSSPLHSLNNGAYFVQVLPEGFPSLTGRLICGYSHPLLACGATQLLCCDAFHSMIVMWRFTIERTSGHGNLAGNPKPLETKGHSPIGLSVLLMCCQTLVWEVEERQKCVRNLGRMQEWGK